ncbi:DMT family transporter [Oceanirhabdus sp. W0125-5]|uniref:DMT family transporter n=1 Tax=Oceanirhabdus sp. W0125-5 TaxID=2999116 RepID=UPI0022F2B456|nr:DMT family transporter [Oceanirhabdus sp. W0125-5]WBW98287.1 DMT family transporter [Oceanirhabdus sp. W0125-5]
MGKIDKNKVILADLALLIVAAVWGGGFVAVKDALDTTSPYFIMTMRFTIATLLMGIFFWKKIKNINMASLKAGVIIGIILFLAFAFQTVGLQYTTASKQSFVTAVYVVMVPFLYWIVTKKRPKAYNFFAAFLCLGGIWFLTLSGESTVGESLISKGDGLTLICALLFAAHIVAVGHYAQKYDPIILTVLQLGVSAVLSFICMILLKQIPTQLGSETMIPILYLAALSTFLAFLIQNVAQKYTYSTHAALIMCLEALFGAIFAVILLNEALTIKMIVGCGLIFISIFISELGTKFLTLNKNKKMTNTIDR